MGPQAGQAQHFQGSQRPHLGAGQDNPAERKMFVLNLNMARNMMKEPEKVGGGRRGGRKDRGDTRERNENPAFIQNMGSIYAE